MKSAMYSREVEFSNHDSFKDASGQSHFPTTLLDGSLMDRVNLSHIKVPTGSRARRNSNKGAK